MEGLTGTDAAHVLLRLLPKEAADRILACLDPNDAAQIRSSAGIAGTAPPIEVQSRVLNAFFQMQKKGPETAPANSGGPNTYSAVPMSAAHSTVTVGDAMKSLQSMDPALLTRALVDEQPSTIAAILYRLEPARASTVLKNLAPERRGEIALRLNQLGMQQQAIVDRIVQAVVEKATRLSEIPPEPSPDDRVRTLAAMLRHMDRTDRADIFKVIEQSDPDAISRIAKMMFQFDDLLVAEDRPLQNLLAEIDVKTLACALKGARDEIAEKIFRNVSSRARQSLTDEIGLLGSVPKNTIQEAQDKVVELLRRYEEEGRISFQV